MNFKLTLSCCLAAGGLMLSGCTDSNYDLGKLDKVIAVGSETEFALPGDNSTKDIQLADILTDIEDNEVIHVDEDGNYYFMRGADTTAVTGAFPEVDEVELVKVDDESDTEYDIAALVVEEARGTAPRQAKGNLSANAKEIYSFSFSGNETPAVLNLIQARLRAKMTLAFNFTDDLKQKVQYIDVLKVGFPEFFDFTIEGEGFEWEGTHTLVFRNLTKDGVRLSVQLNGLNFTTLQEGEKAEDKADEYGYYLTFREDNVQMKAGVMLDVVYNDPAASRSLAKEDLGDLKILCHSEMDDAITLTGAEGQFNPEINLGDDGLGRFNVGDLPDFLQDDEVQLNVMDPQITLGVFSNIDLRGLIEEPQITAYDDKGNVMAVVKLEDFAIEPHKGDINDETKTTIKIKDGNEPGFIHPAKGSERQLRDLLKKIPSSISFACKVAADPNEQGTILMGKNPATNQAWYSIKPSYEVYAPLAFDANSCIVYRDSITGWHEDLEDITLSAGSVVTLTADVSNRLPVDLNFDAFAIELDGAGAWRDMPTNILSVKVANINDGPCIIGAGSELSPTVTKIKITLTQNSTEAFSRIDGIRYRATATMPNNPDYIGTVLNERTQKLKVENIGIKMRGRVVIDLDD